MKPLAVDLFCGKGGWTRGLIDAGWKVVGFDIEDMGYLDHPDCQLVLQDVATIDGHPWRGKVGLIVASPPCQAYSYRAMPWKRAKALPPPDNTLFEACFRIAEEAGCPLIVENVKGAQPWVGRARWHYGSFYLWGDVPALMPPTFHRKVPGFNFHQHEKTGLPGGSLKSAAVAEVKGFGGGWLEKDRNDPRDVRRMPDGSWGIKQNGSGPIWFDTGIAKHSSRSAARKEASARIAMIPYDLAYHIGRIFLP